MHNEIATYGLTNIEGEKVDFILKDIGDLHDKFNGISDAPHRHDYYTIVVFEKANGSHAIDFKEFPIEDQSIHFVYPGQVHKVINPSRPIGWVMNFTREFLLKNNILQELINQVYLYNTYGDSPPLKLSMEEYDRFKNIIQQFSFYIENDTAYKYEALGAILKLFFINITTLCSQPKLESNMHSSGINNLIVNFKNLIEQHYKQLHKVIDYANSLSVSSDYLNKYVKSQTNKSAKEFIQDRLMVEAKRMLLFTEESNKELAYHLGFEEPAHFSNFFKKLAGQTPGSFRTASRK
ncbi:AraC family transcriptional regulator [Labilibacter marinus]|uniref:AraC family transcriptional regulator n=1 Tax=Labilibacter marinus TaxID=1477105 RepID=UPI00082EE1CD|nr:AraC family transcriptional regulator [Labilibacter marinus]